MNWLLWTVISLVGLVGVIALVGYLLPVNHEVSRSAEFNQQPQAVFALISDLPNYHQWWPENETTVAIVESVPPSRFVTKIVGETAFGGTWTMEIVPSGTGSRLTITERGEIYNVVFRTLAKYVLGYTATMDSFLEAAREQLTT